MEQKTLVHLLDSLAAAFERDHRIEQHFYPVRALLHENILLLEGTVKNIAAKNVATSIARHLAGVLPVLDNLQLKSESKEDKVHSDDVANVLLQEPVFTEYSIGQGALFCNML